MAPGQIIIFQIFLQFSKFWTPLANSGGSRGSAPGLGHGERDSKRGTRQKCQLFEVFLRH